MGSLFSSPSKQAGQGASQVQGIDQNMINQLEQYTGQQQQALRGAVAGIGANPYFAAGQAMSPDAYRINPAQTQTFGTSGPGTYLAKLHSISSGPQPVAWNPTGGERMQPGGPGSEKIGPSGPTAPIVPPGGGGGGQWGHGPIGHEPL